MTATSILLLMLLHGRLRPGGLLIHCKHETRDIELSQKGDIAAIQTGFRELSFITMANRRVVKCQIASSSFFSFIDANRVVTIGQDDRVHIVNAQTGSSLSSFPLPGYPVGTPVVCGNFLCIPTGPPGQFTANSTISIMDMSGHVLRKFASVPMSLSPRRHPLFVSQDHRWLVALGYDRVIVYQVGTWQKAADIKGGFAGEYLGGFVTDCAFSWNGKLLFLGNDFAQQIVETRSWKRKQSLRLNDKLIAAFMSKPSEDGFLLLFQDGSIRNFPQLDLIVPGRPYEQAAYCVEGVLRAGWLVTGWENGDIIKQAVRP